MSQNPFELLDLDPLAGAFQITERVRELSEDASEERRRALRELWNELTLHPQTRIAAAVTTFCGEPLVVVEPPRPRSPRAGEEERLETTLETVPFPGLEGALPAAPAGSAPPTPSLQDDPILQEQAR